jgi:hypothetical protein
MIMFVFLWHFSFLFLFNGIRFKKLLNFKFKVNSLFTNFLKYNLKSIKKIMHMEKK